MSSLKSQSLNNQRPRYNMALNPPYQINYRSKRSGKHITITKRRITFQFGFSSASAIASGKTGVECRGEEHEVVLIWSHMTGKRQLFMDGREIHMSKVARGNTKFQYSWGISGNHVLKVVANAVSPMGEQARLHPEIRQFDLFLDGMSYFDFCKIYELGGNDARDEDHSGAVERVRDLEPMSYRGASYHEDEEVEEEATSPVASVCDAPVQTIDVFEVPVASYDVLEAELPSTTRMPSFGSTSCSSNGTYDEFSPRDVGSFDYSQRTFDSVSKDILLTYNNSPGSTVSAESQAIVPANAPPVYTSGEQFKPSMYINNVNADEDQVDEVTKSLKSLVNLDDITSKPFQSYGSNQTTKAKKSNRSEPLPPKSDTMAWNVAGRAPSLAEIQQSMTETNSTQVKKEVMRTYQYQTMQQPGAMVSYGYYGGSSQGAYARAY